MDIFTATLIIISYFVVRFIIPAIILFFIGGLLYRRNHRTLAI